jgi:hypothetical protein
MKRHIRYDYLIVPCTIYWGITMILQVRNPHPFRGLVGSIVLMLGVLSSHIYAMVNRRKTPIFDPDKNNQTLNRIVLIAVIALLILKFGFIYWMVATDYQAY